MSSTAASYRPPHPPGLEYLFRTYGLPERIRIDNGAPFAGTTLARLSTAAVWRIKLGIVPDLIPLGTTRRRSGSDRDLMVASLSNKE